MQTVPISNKVKAEFQCSNCQKINAADVSDYIKREKTLRFNINCNCGNGYTAVLERRKYHRKETHLRGTFVKVVDGKEVSRGFMTVCDLSLAGIRLKVNALHCFSIGDLLEIDFQLDDKQRSTIKKKVVVQNLHFPFIGTKYHSTETIDQALGLYLFE